MELHSRETRIYCPFTHNLILQFDRFIHHISFASGRNLLNFQMEFIVYTGVQFVLGFESVEVLGYISSFAGIGMLVGGVLVSIFGVPNHRVLTILFLSFIQGTNLLSAHKVP